MFDSRKIRERVVCHDNAIKTADKNILYIIFLHTSDNHRLESAGLNALEELLRCWECTEKIVNPACVF